MPSTTAEINGKKVKVFSGVSSLAAADLISKMKEDIKNNPDLKLIQENNIEKKYYLLYSENGVYISAVVISQPDGSCNYQIYKAEGTLIGDDQPLEKTFASMPDAIPALNLKGKENQTIFSYTTKYTADAVVAFYRADMIKKGYREEKLDIPEKLQIKEIESTEILFIKDRKTVIISITIDPSDNSTMVYIVGS